MENLGIMLNRGHDDLGQGFRVEGSTEGHQVSHERGWNWCNICVHACNPLLIFLKPARLWFGLAA